MEEGSAHLASGYLDHAAHQRMDEQEPPTTLHKPPKDIVQYHDQMLNYSKKPDTFCENNGLEI